MKPKRAEKILKRFGWKSIPFIISEPKAIILGAPHTSIWDFIVTYLYCISMGQKAYVLIKDTFFFWPLGPILKSLGGIPLKQGKGANFVLQVINAFKSRDRLYLAIAIEGTRKPVKQWKAGFHTIAKATGVPVYLGIFDWGHKEVGSCEKFEITDDAKADLKRVRQWYKDRGVIGKYPEKFVTGDDLV